MTKEEFDTGLELKNNPPKTYSEELDELNSAYLSSKENLSKAILNAKAWDGTNENPTVQRLRTRGNSLDSTYISDLSELKTKWGK